MKFSRRSFLKSVAAVAAVTAAGIALPSVTAVEAMIEPEVHTKMYPAAVAPDHFYEDDLRREMHRVKAAWEQSIITGDSSQTYVWTPMPSGPVYDPILRMNGHWTPTPFPHPFREPEKYTLATGRVVGEVRA